MNPSNHRTWEFPFQLFVLTQHKLQSLTDIVCVYSTIDDMGYQPIKHGYNFMQHMCDAHNYPYVGHLLTHSIACDYNSQSRLFIISQTYDLKPWLWIFRMSKTCSRIICMVKIVQHKKTVAHLPMFCHLVMYNLGAIRRFSFWIIVQGW